MTHDDDYDADRSLVHFAAPTSPDSRADGGGWDENKEVGRLTVKQISKTLPLFLQLVENCSISLTSLECRRRNLDDLFLAMSGRRLDD